MAAVDKGQLQKMLDDAGVTYAPDATIPDLLEQISGVLANANAVQPVLVKYTVVEAIDVATEEDQTDVKNPGDVVELDSNDAGVQEWAKDGLITPLVTEAAPTRSEAGQVPPTAPQAASSVRTAMSAVVEQQKEEEKLKSQFDLTTKEGRWIKFLADARRVNPARFDRQLEAGEFDEIARTFEPVELEKSVGTPRGV